ncbi:ABC transporter permease [Sphingobium jiangsuense]|uniref:Sulfonate transport system permease protein n=1 Tax=Sphingobium jiangsuense TaxID=870476 RepID=A0A7W6BNX1_9SPHN|nr:ABC transporter permease [Sphingobium jiangsuense]MBB3926063.1 sulfonate transport system permease protein [Sphingobium jiangsuense]GLT00550.1 ABC transporter permease [Sphingobium jiangsuense]
MTGLLSLSRAPVRFAIGLAAPVLLLLWWQWQATAHISTFAPPGAVGQAAAALIRDGTLLNDMLATLGRAFGGLFIGAPLGVATGVAMGIWRPLDRLLGPLLHGLRQVPMIGWLPLIGLWFGVGEGTELIVVSMSAFFPAMLNSHAGVAQVERRYEEVGRIYGFGTVQRIRFILLPAAMPLVLTGLTQSLAFAWIATIGTEILTGAGSGLGVTMQLAQTQQRLDIMLVTIAATALLGFVINHLFLRLRRRLLRWQPSSL